ncbi:MAG: transposase [Lachnospiraceae bacterium]
MSKHFRKEHTFWSDGYFSSSIDYVSQETIQKYIESQSS